MHAAEVISVCKTIFAEYGTPGSIYTDQGTQFKSEEFKQFAELFGFTIEHSSPRHPQANGFAESMVKITKGLMMRALEAKEDAHLALQIYRATPCKVGMPSPAELLNSRTLRTGITLHASTALTAVQRAVHERMVKDKLTMKELYDKKATAYKDLQLHQSVRFQKDQQNKMQPSPWVPANHRRHTNVVTAVYVRGTD